MARALVVLLVVAGGCVTEGDVLTPVASQSPGEDGYGDEDCTTLECPISTLDDAAFCGRVIDLETSEIITESAPVVRFFEEDEFKDRLAEAPALAVVQPDSCGRFATTIRLDDMDISVVMQTGKLSITPDDDAPYRSAFSILTKESEKNRDLEAYALRTATDLRWGGQAGQGDEGTASKGPLVAIFRDVAGEPVTSVQITLEGEPREDEDFYFSDDNPIIRSTISLKESETGIAGASMLIVPGVRPEGVACGGDHEDTVVEEPCRMLGLPGQVQVQVIKMVDPEQSVPPGGSVR